MSSELSFCKLGWHRPLQNHEALYKDHVDGEIIYKANCGCGKVWLVDRRFSYLGLTVETKDWVRPPPMEDE
jgi:hypothetical protein